MNCSLNKHNNPLSQQWVRGSTSHIVSMNHTVSRLQRPPYVSAVGWILPAGRRKHYMSLR